MKSGSHAALILGGSGKVGSALRAVWPDDQPAVWQARSGGNFAWDILAEAPPPCPRHISGVVGLAGTAHGFDLEANTALAVATCTFAAENGLRVLLASSQAVYGRMREPASEASPCEPDTGYGRAKLAMEKAVSHFPNVTILRIGNVVGCDSLMLNVARGEPIRLDQFSNGKGPQRSYLGPVVFGEILRNLLSLDGPLPPVLNVSQSGLIGMEALLEVAQIPWEWVPAGPKALPKLELDTSLLQSLIEVPAANPSDLIAQARASGWPNQ